MLLSHVLEESLKKDPDIAEVYLHVQTSNDEAKSFYISHGFQEIETVLNYYRNIDPPHSFMLSKKLN